MMGSQRRTRLCLRLDKMSPRPELGACLPNLQQLCSVACARYFVSPLPGDPCCAHSTAAPPPMSPRPLLLLALGFAPFYALNAHEDHAHPTPARYPNREAHAPRPLPAR